MLATIQNNVGWYAMLLEDIRGRVGEGNRGQLYMNEWAPIPTVPKIFALIFSHMTSYDT